MEMRKIKSNQILDFVPLLILILLAIRLCWVVINSDIIFSWQHIIALIWLTIILILLYKNHKLGIVCLGLFLISGYWGLVSLSPTLETYSSSLDFGKLKIPLSNGQPIIILLTFFHFIFSHRYYFGIVTKKYWKNILIQEKNEPTIEDHLI